MVGATLEREQQTRLAAPGGISLVSASSFLAYGICMILPTDKRHSKRSPKGSLIILFTSTGVIRDYDGLFSNFWAFFAMFAYRWTGT